jgi:glucose/arabinose dehydrogenase
MKNILLSGVSMCCAATLILASCKRDDKNIQPDPQNNPGKDWPMATISAQTRMINIDDLPAADTNASVTNYPQVLMERPTSASFQAPAGFVVNLFQDDVPNVRTLCVAPNGDVFVGVSASNKIMILRDQDKDGYAETKFTWDEGGVLNRPYGMAFYQNKLYVANSGAVVRYDYSPGQTKATGTPTSLGTYPGGGQHPYRSLVLDTVNQKMYIGIGSTMNVGFEDDSRYASVQVFNITGGTSQTYTSGIRNPQALAINHASGRPVLWSAVNERDGMGDQLVPDYFTELAAPGLFYGWPYVYLRADKPDPRIKTTSPLVASTKSPEVLLEAHCAALGLMFYNGTQFPEEYRGDAYIAMRGSWNRSDASGYKVVRVKMNASGKAEGGYEDFLKGWRINEGAGKPEVFGRPVSLAMAADGSMLITDDAGGAVWRLRWKGN